MKAAAMIGRLRETLALCMILAGVTHVAGKSVIDIDPNDSIQATIDLALDGDEIVVAPGMYDQYFDLKGKAIVLRSSAGPEQTIISGPSVGRGGARIITCNSGEDPNTVIDGFTIMNGYSSWGGGMLNQNSSPTVKHCIFRMNETYQFGGGMLNDHGHPIVMDSTFIDNEGSDGGGGMGNLSSSPSVYRCQFLNNQGGSGGGMLNVEDSHPILNECNFSQNTAYLGGGLQNQQGCHPLLIDCTFSENSSGSEGGGGMQNTDECNPTLLHCQFDNNMTDGDGGGLINANDSNPLLIGCRFVDNVADQSGGGISNGGYSHPTLIDCDFIRNESTNRGGGGFANFMFSDPIFENCRFIENRTLALSVASNGGGLFSSNDCSPHISHSEFLNNTAGLNGGGLYVYSGAMTLDDCIFVGNHGIFGGGAHFTVARVFTANCGYYGNTSNYSGGGLETYSCDVDLINCLFSGNRTVDRGGAIYARHGEFNLYNCTLSGNRSGNQGGGMYHSDGAIPTLTNCIVSGNVAPDHADYYAVDYNPDVTYTCMRNVNPFLGNISTADPLFVDPNGPDGIVGTLDDDLRLLPDSPCIDAGLSFALTLDDVAGRHRIVDDPNTPDTGLGIPAIIDMGAYEFGATLLRDFDFDDDADVCDLAILQQAIAGQAAGVDLDHDGDVDGDDFVICQQRITGPRP